MLISLGPQAFIMPAPVMLVGTYDADGRPNVMAASWGGLCCSQPPCLSVSLRRATWTYQSLMERRAFTVSIPGRDQVGVADFAGLVSGRTEDKFKALGIAPIAGEHVDAPYLEGSPVVLELLLRHTLELGSHTQFIGEIMDVKVRKDCLTADGLPDPARISALHYVPLIKEYYSGGEFTARAFAVGKTVKKQNQASSY
ncbi:MAG: flavin reductase family protein [Mailhella sp.]|nr:flavin reductase family protein [Mailhella sp.]MBQ9105498.1 flavin reductase family protein [Mailhella sp.]